MVKKFLTTMLLAVFLTTSVGCFGSFSLTKKMYSWNESVGDKFINSAVMWVFLIVPVYEACSFIDLVALNLIEFWTGSNPMALNAEKESQKTFSANGKTYEATMGRGSITIVESEGPNAGKSVTMTLNSETMTWNLLDGITSRTVASLNPNPINTVDLYYPDGTTETHILATTPSEIASIR